MKKLGWRKVVLLVVDRQEGRTVVLHSVTTRQKVFKHKQEFWVEDGGRLRHVEKGADGTLTELAVVEPSVLAYAAGRREQDVVNALRDQNEAGFLSIMGEPVTGPMMKTYLEKKGWKAVPAEVEIDLLLFENAAYPGRQLNFARDEAQYSDFAESMDRIVEKLAELEQRHSFLIRNELSSLRRLQRIATSPNL